MLCYIYRSVRFLLTRLERLWHSHSKCVMNQHSLLTFQYRWILYRLHSPSAGSFIAHSPILLDPISLTFPYRWILYHLFYHSEVIKIEKTLELLNCKILSYGDYLSTSLEKPFPGEQEEGRERRKASATFVKLVNRAHANGSPPTQK